MEGAALPNGVGVLVNEGASGNTIGGTAAGSGNVIAGNTNGGIEIDGAAGLATTSNIVQGNFIGINDKNAVLANKEGVTIAAAATGNTIGGSAAARNFISGNLDNGVVITGAGTSTNLVQDNYIGTDTGGTVSLGNVNDGVLITGGADQNTIGGAPSATGSLGNVISANGQDGVGIVAAGAMGNTLQGNDIGTDKNGTAKLGNKRDGVRVDGSPNNKIGLTLGTSPDNLISGNTHEGMDLTGANSTGNTVRGNYIGTDIKGTTGLGNGGEGVQIDTGADGNTVGGTSPQRNVISANVDGVYILSAGNAGNTIQGNYIGTDKNGSTSTGLDALPLSNQLNGVVVSKSSNNKIGVTLGSKPDNVISGNGASVLITGDNLAGIQSAGNTVRGNYIGTDATGELPLANTRDGVQFNDDAVNNVVGGAANQRNVISANVNGVHLSDATTTNNTVAGNYIGIDATGLTATGGNGRGLGNTTSGVLIDNGANTNTVGGVQAQGNVISGNATGVLVSGMGTTANLVQGNMIGTDSTGKAVNSPAGNALGNTGFGVQIDTGANGNTVGGGAGLGNVVSGNNGGGVLITGAGTNGNLVQGNAIGLDINRATALPNTVPLNTADGVDILAGAANNIIGGAGLGNTVSGNRGYGVLISGAGTNGNMVQANFIGTDSAGGTAIGKDGQPLGNNSGGVTISAGATNNTIGGAPGLGNTISGNGGGGILIVGAATTPNLVQRNFIGTDPTGSFDVDKNGQPLGNQGDGIFINGVPGITIGGVLGSGNVISGNAGNGINIFSAGAGANNIVESNFIGTDAAARNGLPNTLNGILIGAPAVGPVAGNIIGALPNLGNFISANGQNGVLIQANATLNTLDGNKIGVDVNGGPLGNALDGVQINASNNTIGAAAPGANDNTIDFNGRAGVSVLAGTGDKISGDAIYGNKRLGIDLNGDGVTFNRPGSPHVGPNLLISYPDITSVTATPGGVSIAGSLDSSPNTAYTIEFFTSPNADPSGFGQGQNYFGSVNVVTDNTGHAAFAPTFNGTIPAGSVVTATARDGANNTSELSAAIAFAAKLSGTVFLDDNASGVQDPGEPGLPNRTVYLDLNHDGVLDNGEPTVTTDANGTFSFGILPAGVYQVREDVLKNHGVVITAPPGGFYTITVPGGSDTKLDFGNVSISQVSPVEVVAHRFGPAPDADTAFVQGVYRNLLARDPDQAGATYWDQQLAAGLSRQEFTRRIWESAEHRAMQVDHYFETFLRRPADSGGRDYWIHTMLNGATEQQVVVDLMSSAEYRALHPTDADFVPAVYADVLSRPADNAGLSFWEAALARGVPRQQVATIFAGSAESDRRGVEGYFAAFLHRAADGSGDDFWSNQIVERQQALESVAIAFLAGGEYFAGARALSS